jgi:hypothetical protein
MHATAWWPPTAGPRCRALPRSTWRGSFAAAGVAAIVYTDIDRDGMMQGREHPGDAPPGRGRRHSGDRLGGRDHHRGHPAAVARGPRAVSSARSAGRALYEGTLDLRERAGLVRRERRRGLSMGLAKRIIPCLDVDKRARGQGRALRGYPRCGRPGGDRQALQRAGRRRTHVPRHHREPRAAAGPRSPPWSAWPARCSSR